VSAFLRCATNVVLGLRLGLGAGFLGHDLGPGKHGMEIEPSLFPRGLIVDIAGSLANEAL
jgi:hypothetical protein